MTGGSGSGLLISQAPLTEEQKACLDLLKEAANEAQRGKIISVAIVVCMDGGLATVMAGRRAGDLYLGCGELQAKILDAVMSGNVAKKPSNIIRARPAG